MFFRNMQIIIEKSQRGSNCPELNSSKVFPASVSSSDAQPEKGRAILKEETHVYLTLLKTANIYSSNLVPISRAAFINKVTVNG